LTPDQKFVQDLNDNLGDALNPGRSRSDVLHWRYYHLEYAETGHEVCAYLGLHSYDETVQQFKSQIAIGYPTDGDARVFVNLAIGDLCPQYSSMKPTSTTTTTEPTSTTTAAPPAVGDSCLHGQLNSTTTGIEIPGGGPPGIPAPVTTLRCLSDERQGYIWMPDPGVAQSPGDNGQLAWSVCHSQGYTDEQCRDMLHGIPTNTITIAPSPTP
jgi:hypothetical protein